MRKILNSTPVNNECKQQENSGDDSVKEFERMLEEFISSGLNYGKAPDEEPETEDEMPEPEELPEEEETDEEDDETPIDLPSGIVEQNANLCVKVRILPPMARPREELDRLVGCADIKARLGELLALTRYNRMLRKAFPQAKEHEVSLHSIFFGRPGTGKTTVCKIFGSLLHEAGALSKGHVVVADRGTFIGSLWGDEERSVRQVLEMARGGVLMIDEAYLLNGKNDHDPGKIVIQLLMDVLADEDQRDIAVVLCGYKEPMMRLLDSNPGLPSRFPNRFEFSDFSVDDLLEISRRRVDRYRYHFTPQAWQKYSEVLAAAYRERDPQTWGNARFVANQLERIYIRHAQRCTQGKTPSGRQLLTLTPADIVSVEVPRPKPHIGF
ncbi:MAG: AAA family ATPase [Bacteroidaceae bacterium]|nr:AAA family ATPase [Bacteroidaceae bacterium]